MYYIFKYMCNPNYTTDKFIHAPTSIYIEVMCLLELAGVAKQAYCHVVTRIYTLYLHIGTHIQHIVATTQWLFVTTWSFTFQCNVGLINKVHVAMD